MRESKKVLISWIAVNNDPFEKDRDNRKYRLVNNEPVAGPTLTLLFDDDSPFLNQIGDVVLLHRKSAESVQGRESEALEATIERIKARSKNIRVQKEEWVGDDPTDHLSIFEYLRKTVPILRHRFAGRELVIHISPGTPSMQTIWVLMAETGFIEPPFQLVKSYRKTERRGRPAVISVKLGLDTFYKVYKASRPLRISSEEQSVVWDPGKFQTSEMKHLFVEARRFARLNVPVLILGERGTGKTTLANWIRLHSPFRRENQDSHWPAVACGQYSPETMRSELFGYKKGSFTGASQDREGLLALANNDTLFLDEIGDISRDLQRLLIKALEEKKYLPLGDDRPKSSSFRLLTATNLEMSSLQERLDPDFLDRISLLTLRIPPLREVKNEINWLWETVYEQATRRAAVAKHNADLSDSQHRSIVSRLKMHHLYGNLRDLFRIAYRIIAAQSDPHTPLSPSDAVEYGLESLNSGPDQDCERTNLSKAVAFTFAKDLPLDSLIDEKGRLLTKFVDNDLKAYLAEQLKRIAKSKNVPIEQICDVTDRTLRTWQKNEWKKSSRERK